MLVLDTGLRTAEGRPEHPELVDCSVIHRPWLDPSTPGAWDDEDEPADRRPGILDHQGGHGTFITGIIRQLCPDAWVHHAGVLSSFGDGDDVSVIAAIERAAVRPDRIDIVVMSFGAYSVGDRPPPMTATIERVLSHALVIASAGNNASLRPFFPAALPDVVAVGALDSAGRAPFSNYGPWVDACAPAVDVVSTFFTDFGEYRGWAAWSGTSFAAPKLAGVVAQEMYLNDLSAKEAWARLQSYQKFRYPDLGQVFNV